MIHNLKILEPFYRRNEDERVKPWELRKNDRDFQVWDFIIFEVWNYDKVGMWIPQEKDLRYKITYLLQGFEGLKEGYCIMSIEFDWVWKPNKK